ncbi:MAG: SWIM zinc finger family protein, partial [Chitinophagaceae bacterium]
MTLQTFEQLLGKKYLEKGLDYFNNGCVSELEEWETSNRKAIVCGTEDYHVTVKLKKDVIKECSCDCPHDVDHCKHIIAVLYALKEEGTSPPVKINIKEPTTGAPKKMKAKATVASIVSKTSEKELRRFIIEYAETDRQFRNMLHAHFADKSGEDGKRIYTEMIKNAARIAADRSGFIDYYHANKAIQPVDVLLEKAHAAVAKKHYGVTADIAFAVIEGVHDMMIDMDDSGGGAGNCIKEGFGLLINLCEADIPIDLKERIFR